MPHTIGFDIYGTMVDPLEMNEHLRPLVGEGLADRFSELWRNKQIEYAFRRALMRRYEDFDICTKQALVFAAHALGVELSEENQEKLVEEYQNLRPFPDVVPGLEAMREGGHALVAFSNGVEATTRTLMERAGILLHLESIISADDLKTFKPDPQVYLYLAGRLQRRPEETWLVSSNPFDVIGAKASGLKAAWVRCSPDVQFDPWGIEPDLIVPDLQALAGSL